LVSGIAKFASIMADTNLFHRLLRVTYFADEFLFSRFLLNHLEGAAFFIETSNDEVFRHLPGYEESALN
jgi:hypothetical protein